MSDYDRIATLIQYLDQHRSEQPELAELADVAGISPFHLHRLFRRWVGVTPKGFLKCLTLTHARDRLLQGESVLQAALETGLSGPGRLHDLCVTLTAASPGEIKAGGGGWTIVAGMADCPFGTCLVGESPRGICHFSFVAAKDRGGAEVALRADWPRAAIRWDDRRAKQLVAAAFRSVDGRQSGQSLNCYVRGTPFQVRVWQALLRIPVGQIVSYGQVADAVCSRTAARAVGAAIGQNRIGVLIPCHRVIRETGVLGDYRWDKVRKHALIAWEAARAEPRKPANRNETLSATRVS
jgi:AraC family transcriptional regulator of adaptative response/methylated-DNA-[protein]-cysteine methyltransferase